LDKKLKIAIIGSRGYPYVYSGYETLVKELSERLVKKGHSVRVYCHSSLFNPKPKYVNGIELVYTPSIETKFFSQFINSLFSFIHVCFSNVDVVLTVNSANGPFGILTKLFRKRTCINVDGLEWLRPKWKGIGSIYFKISSRLSTYFFDKIISDSVEMFKIYREKFKIDSNVIAYGSTMIKINNEEVLKQYKLSKNEYYLIVGRLIPDNNAMIIIEGFLKSDSNKKLVIVGDVPYDDFYANSVKNIKSEKIILTGYINCQKELSQLYKYCFGYIHGHQYGGTNPTMINALDFNCEILSIDTAFTREMLKSKKAIFFKRETESIIISLLNFENQIDDLTEINSNYTLPKIYDWDEIVNEYENLFESLIKDSI